MTQIEFANFQEAVVGAVGPVLELGLGLVLVLGVVLSIILVMRRHGRR